MGQKAEAKSRIALAKERREKDLESTFDHKLKPGGMNYSVVNRSRKNQPMSRLGQAGILNKKVSKKSKYISDRTVNKVANKIYGTSDRSMREYTSNVRGVSKEMAAVKGV